MKKTVAVMLLAAFALAGCKKYAAAEAERGARHGGRYFGIGIYSANTLWEHLVRKEERKATSKSPQAATLKDDSEIIVIVDSRTGEIRQCGNYSGYCLSSNPWKGEAGSSPAALAKHAADLERESRQSTGAEAR